jgi:hypothetical protein
MRLTLLALSALAVLATGYLGGPSVGRGQASIGRRGQDAVVVTRYRALPRLLFGAVPGAYPGRLTAGRRRAALLGPTRFQGEVRLDARGVDCRTGGPACRAIRVLLRTRRPRRLCIGVLPGHPPGADLAVVTGRLDGRPIHLVVTTPACASEAVFAATHQLLADRA